MLSAQRLILVFVAFPSVRSGLASGPGGRRAVYSRLFTLSARRGSMEKLLFYIALFPGLITLATAGACILLARYDERNEGRSR